MSKRGLIGGLLALAAVAAVIVGEIATSGTGAAKRPAPQLPTQVLRGPGVDLASLRGKPALVNFWASWCDPCKQEAPELERFAKTADGRAELVGVDWNDTTANAKAFLKDHQMTGRMDWLIGSSSQLQRTWKTWGIATRVPKQNPELVEHSAEIFGIDASGTVRTLYPANFKPKWIVHDVPILASE